MTSVQGLIQPTQTFQLQPTIECKPNILSKVTSIINNNSTAFAILLILFIVYYLFRWVRSLFRSTPPSSSSSTSSSTFKPKNELDDLIEQIQE